MPWQQLVADVAGEIDPATGQLWYTEVVITVPRQSGKTTLVNSVTTHRATVMARRLGRRQVMAYTAQTGLAARQKLEREFAEALRQSRHFREVDNPKLRPRSAVEWMYRANSGDEHILFGRLKSILMAKPPTPKAGHGDVLDLGFIDEAFSRQDDAVEQAMQPAMLTRPSAQLWVVSTAGDDNPLQNIQSFYLWDKVEAGRARCESGDHGRVAYFEWSDDEGDPGDPQTWRRCSPALGYTITEAALEDRFRKALESPDPDAMRSFCRAYLNRWPRIPRRPVVTGDGFTSALWVQRQDASSEAEGRVRVAVDASPGLASVSVAVAGRRVDGRQHVELVAHRLGDRRWVAPFVAALTAESPGPVGIVSGSPAEALAQALETAGVEVELIGAKAYAGACLGFVTSAIDDGLRHRSGPLDGVLAEAVAGAARAKAGDGGFTWSRMSSAIDICPLVAVTAAHHLAGDAVDGDEEANLW